MNQEVLCEYLIFLRRNRGQGTIALVMNQHPAYLAPLYLAKAQELDIRLIFVPRSGTTIYQPLDRRVHGAMKSKARGKFDQLSLLDSKVSVNKEMGANHTREC
jgi:hypothetical protein